MARKLKREREAAEIGLLLIQRREREKAIKRESVLLCLAVALGIVTIAATLICVLHHGQAWPAPLSSGFSTAATARGLGRTGIIP
jgi:hypothetical protein